MPTISPSHLPARFRPCSFCYSNENLIEFLNISGSKCADDYGHHIMCNYFLIERKSSGAISKAIIQLEETLKLLLEKEKPVKEVIIICNHIDKTNSKLYETRSEFHNGIRKKFLFDKQFKKVICANHDTRYPIEVLYQ